MRKISVVLLSLFFSHLLFAQGTSNTVAGNNQFAFKLFAKLQSSHNLFFSPFSISSALAMTYTGAKGETQEQMKAALCFNPRADSVNMGFEKIMKTMNTDTLSGVKLCVANSLWVENKFHFLDSYVNLVKQYYNSEVRNVDFANESTRDTINNWVAKRTNNKIQNLLPKKSVGAETKAVLINTLYFYGKWATEFQSKASYKGTFYCKTKDTVQSTFMISVNHFNYFEDEKFQIVELPYKGKSVSMLIFLPDSGTTLALALKEFTDTYYTNAIRSLQTEHVKVVLPKFKTTQSFNLSEILKKVGMETAFTGTADFSGMTGNKELYISAVLHKAFIAVTEQGTEAAAATAVLMPMTSTRPTPLKTFKADHPFFFVIRENNTGSILFMGQMNNPNH